jgi:hypothetical protein
MEAKQYSVDSTIEIWYNLTAIIVSSILLTIILLTTLGAGF